MARFKLPIPTDSRAFTYEISLGETSFILEFLFNERFEHWSLTVQDQGGAELRAGEFITSDWEVFGIWYDFAVRPPGRFIIIDTEGKGVDPVGPDLFNQRVKLIFSEFV